MIIPGPTDCLLQDSNNFGTNVTAGASSSRHKKTGSIAGGSIGALFLLGIALVAFWVCKNWRRVMRRAVFADDNNTGVQPFTHNDMGTILVRPFEVPLSVLQKASRQKVKTSRGDEDPSTPKPDERSIVPSDQHPPSGVEETTPVPARRGGNEVPEVIYHRDGGRAVVEVPPAYDDLSGDADGPTR